MRKIAMTVLQQLDLDYGVTLVSGGASGKYEIVMWDKPRDSYFSIRLIWERDAPTTTVAEQIKAQLRQRLAVLHSSCDGFAERRPRRQA